MDRRAFVTALFSMLAASLAAEAQQAGKVARLGYLSLLTSPPTSPSPLRAAFLQGLRDFGWVEGSNLAIEIRKPERRPGEGPPAPTPERATGQAFPERVPDESLT